MQQRGKQFSENKNVKHSRENIRDELPRSAQYSIYRASNQGIER